MSEISECSNPSCRLKMTVQKAQSQVPTFGMAMAMNDETVFQVIKCSEPGCTGRHIIRSSKKSPALDMRQLFLVPCMNVLSSAAEQSWILRNWNAWNDFLQFEIIPVWDNSLKREDFLDSRRRQKEYPTMLGPSLIMAEEVFFKHFSNEISDGKVRLRRFFPSHYRNLLMCLAPNKINRIDTVGAAYADGFCLDDVVERPKAWKALLQEATGKTFEAAVKETLSSKAIPVPDALNIEKLVGRELSSFGPGQRNKLWDIVSKIEFAKDFKIFCEQLFRTILFPACTELALADNRKDLLKWPAMVEKGQALFVDAPMGIGKSYSIVEALASAPNCSAVLFMPTKRLCQEMIYNLKTRIAEKLGLGFITIGNGKEWYEDETGETGCRFSQEFLKDEVFYVDGINPEECPSYNEITQRYSCGLLKKIDVCRKCEKFLKKGSGGKQTVFCRFRRHSEDAPYARIIVTTHQQYKKFQRIPSFRKWRKTVNGLSTHEGENASLRIKDIDRDYFIIDEDLILSECYAPISMNDSELRGFVGVVTNFINNLEASNNNSIAVDAIANIDRVLAQYAKCGSSSVIAPLAPGFKIPEYIKQAWDDAFNNQQVEAPEFLDWTEPFGNRIELIERAIQKGLVVQKYNAVFNQNGKQEEKTVEKAFFSNPTEYDLSGLPPHVFFDGTPLNEKFLKAKLRNVEFKRVEINVMPIWNIKVFQNIWTELPKTKMKIEQERVMQFVRGVIHERGQGLKYFFVTKKDLESGYLREFLQAEFPDLDYVLSHYGNLRGENNAKDCVIAIVLGNYSLPDAVEIAMALEFIQDTLKPNSIISTNGIDGLWTRTGENFRRTYRDCFSVVGEMADACRHSEQRQALARTRYFSHDVDFYVLSKDLVADYEPYLARAETYRYREDLWAKKQRSDSGYQKTVKAVAEWLKTNKKVRRRDIANVRGMRDGTIGDHMKEMAEKGMIVKPFPNGHSYILSEDWEIRNGEFIMGRNQIGHRTL